MDAIMMQFHMLARNARGAQTEAHVNEKMKQGW